MIKFLIKLTMSLFTPADGIMKTNVQWDDLQESVIEAFGADAIFGPNKQVKDVGCGNGFMSKICLVSPDWQTKMKDVPERFIVKISSQLPLLESQGLDETGHFTSEEFAKKFEDDVKRLHNNEAHLYNLFKKYGNTDIPTPKVYFTKKYSDGNPLKGYIIMEYISDGVPYHIFDNLKPESMQQAMRAIAKLEAAATKFSEEERAPFEFSPIEDMFKKFFSKDANNAFFTMLRSSGGERLAVKIDNLETILDEITDLDNMIKIPTSLGMEKVLCHGDLWSTNMIWRKGAKDVELAAVIDFQGAHYGNPTVDIVRVMCACMSGKDRREHWESLLEKFYSYLQEELENRNMPYTLDMLKEAYQRYFPLGAFLIVPMIGPMFQMVTTSGDVDYKAKVQEVVFEKVECLLDDIWKMHNENKQHSTV
ncbi:CHK domain-containing protein [Trichostrongylus colubriformis]|uniref:CHK domain-containing protein n=1 Tax=Trichostrongylus colubriformis TaxID=6319 RepID=A0AAN8FKR7_TRICO